MRALLCEEYGPPESLQLAEIDDPVAGTGQVVIDVHAAGINFPDLLIIAGQYQVKTPPPFVPGNEAAGVVSSVGDGVTHVQPGDRVAAYTTGGAFAEKFLVPAATVVPLPEQLDFEQGAGFMVTYGTALHALKQRANLAEGETLLVLGAAGGVGSAAVQIGKAMGARVIAAAAGEQKLRFTELAGADEVIDYSEKPLKESVRALTEGKGVDVVVDPVGGEYAEQAYRALAWHGRYLVIGFAGGDIPSFKGNIALLKEASVLGVWWGTWVARNPAQNRENLDTLSAMIEAGTLQPRSTAAFPLDQFVDAFKSISERRALGKVLLTMR